MNDPHATVFINTADPNLVDSLLDKPSTIEVSVVCVTRGWASDLERLSRSLAAQCSDHSYELVVVSNHSPEVEETAAQLLKEGIPIRGIFFSQEVGYGGACNAGIHIARGEVVAVADSSIEATGDFIPEVTRALERSSVGLVGKWGLLSPDLLHFDEATSGEVDAMQAYLMAFRRADAATVGLLDPKFKFYRNADIDFSLQFRDHRLEVLALDLPLVRHEHREWESMPADQREKKSRENHARLMRKWRDRTDLLTGRAEAHHH